MHLFSRTLRPIFLACKNRRRAEDMGGISPALRQELFLAERTDGLIGTVRKHALFPDVGHGLALPGQQHVR